MSDRTSPAAPGLRTQSAVRTGLRVAGGLLALVGLGLTVTAGIEFFTLQGFEEPHRFWMFFVGIPALGIGLMMLQAGFAGAGARYAAGEYAPVVKDTAEYLTDGKGLRNLGVRDGDSPAAGPYCRSCGTRNDADARFCDSCGTAMA
ncbi:MAG: zinc ribbon domain-containing protein [Nocardioides sp.]